jgi:chromosome segregation ATPase
MLRSPGWREGTERIGASTTPAPQRAYARRTATGPDPQETLALVENAGAAFETLQLQLLSLLQKAKGSLQDADQEKAQLQDEIEVLAREKDDWSQRARKAEATLDRANQVLQTQQSVLEKALLREREAVQRAYMLELKLRQMGGAGRPG